MGRDDGNIVECYVVRIYRRDRSDPSLAEGVVEGTDGEALKVFHNAAELLDGLDLPAQNTVGNRKKKSKGGSHENSH